MKMLLTGDWHGDWVTMGVPRYTEVENAAEETVRAAVDQRVDLYVFMGDLTDPDSGPSVFRCVDLALRTANELSRRRITSFWLAGNHDVSEDGTGTTTLTPLRSGNERSEHTLFERPYVVDFGLHFLMLPFTAASHTYNPEELAKEFVAKNDRGVVLGHLSVPGVIPGEETTEMPRGRDVRFPVEVFKDKPDFFLANGHYHRRQRSPDGVWMPGSLARLTFGEEDHKPSYLIVEL